MHFRFLDLKFPHPVLPIVLALYVGATASNAISSCPGAPKAKYTLNTAPGWKVMPVVGGLTLPRGLTIDKKGNLLVVERGFGVTAHSTDDNGCVTSRKVVIEERTLNHGLALDPAGDRIYATSVNTTWEWEYDPVSLTVKNRRVLVTGMHDYFHFVRAVLIPKDDPNLLVLSYASNDNIDMESFQVTNGRASVRVFDLDSIPAGGVAFNDPKYGRVLGYGLRLPIGLEQDRAGNVLSSVHSIDYPYRVINGIMKDIQETNPADVIFNLGKPTHPQAHFGGYPHCFTSWDPSTLTDAKLNPGDWFTLDNSAVPYNDPWCRNATGILKPVVMTSPNTEPSDIKLGVGTDSNLYVPLYGSFRRHPPQGYKVIAVPGRFSPSGEWSPTTDLAGTKTSAVEILTNVEGVACAGAPANNCFRPISLVFDPTGENLYVTGDQSGEILMLKREAGPTI